MVADFLLRGGEVTLQLSEPAKFTWQREQLPDRLVIDIADCEIAGLSRQLVRSSASWYDRVRVEKRSDSLHLVFYIRPDARPEVLSESPADSLVISPGRGYVSGAARQAARQDSERQPVGRNDAVEAPTPEEPRAQLATRAAVESIAIRPSGEGVVDVVIQLSRAIRPMSFPLFTDPAKPRIVVDFPGAVIEPAQQRFEPGDKSLVTHVHTGMFEGRTPRIVVNLTRRSGYQQITEENPFRVTLRIGGQAVPVPEPVVPLPEPEPPTGVFRPGALRGSTVVVDAGHGGHDPGTRHGGLREKDVALDIAKRLAALLTRAGARAVMTRSDDRFISVKGRPAMANSINADLFVSIHCNHPGGPRILSGTETYYHFNNPVQKQMARVIQSHLVATLGLPDRGIRSDGIRFPGVGFGVLRHARMPAVLVEVGYINSPLDSAKLRDPEGRQKAAEGIFRGLRAFREGRSGVDPGEQEFEGTEMDLGAIEEAG